ncbi:CRISPR-associated endonuclease Cas2 [Salipiger abyssi]|uniref:CRISPR-associated endonuclease Cas2 n=1 Tax=Salipiger abyssi TaxID=1250539 RepID=UPI001A8CAF52|nr:CRISPR-associated endonuclease Cas2 [Salipiger abyssi]MBN9890541.1 CRISPR-associated endonuclease Cas2 [Salipiger abyssi]
MARGEMLTVFTYDISRNKIRRKAAKILEDEASRVQKSVFEVRMTEARAAAVSQRVAALLDPGDSLRVYVIGANGEHRTRVFGDAVPIEPRSGYWLA